MKILVISSNPAGNSDYLEYANKEYEYINKAGSELESKRKINIKHESDISFEELGEKMNSAFSEDIVGIHFVGHSSNEKIFLTKNETSEGVDLKYFADLISSLSKLKFIFLNSCYSEDFVKEIAYEKRDLVIIATRSRVGDSMASLVAKEFYEQLFGAPKTIIEAGKNTINKFEHHKSDYTKVAAFRNFKGNARKKLKEGDFAWGMFYNEKVVDKSFYRMPWNEYNGTDNYLLSIQINDSEKSDYNQGSSLVKNNCENLLDIIRRKYAFQPENINSILVSNEKEIINKLKYLEGELEKHTNLLLILWNDGNTDIGTRFSTPIIIDFLLSIRARNVLFLIDSYFSVSPTDFSGKMSNNIGSRFVISPSNTEGYELNYTELSDFKQSIITTLKENNENCFEARELARKLKAQRSDHNTFLLDIELNDHKNDKKTFQFILRFPEEKRYVDAIKDNRIKEYIEFLEVHPTGDRASDIKTRLIPLIKDEVAVLLRRNDFSNNKMISLERCLDIATRHSLGQEIIDSILESKKEAEATSHMLKNRGKYSISDLKLLIEKYPNIKYADDIAEDIRKRELKEKEVKKEFNLYVIKIIIAVIIAVIIFLQI